METLPAVLVFYNLNRSHQAQAAGFAHDGVLGQAGPALIEIRGGIVLHTLDNSFSLHDPQIGQRHRAGDGVAGIGVTMCKFTAFFNDDIGYPVTDQRTTQWQIS